MDPINPYYHHIEQINDVSGIIDFVTSNEMRQFKKSINKYKNQTPALFGPRQT
jgi:hypothetical protein